MSETLQAFRRLLRSIEAEDGPVLTVSLDLRQGPPGAPPPARTVAKEAFSLTLSASEPATKQAAEAFEGERELLERAVEEAIASGALGLLYVSLPLQGTRDELHLPLPVRNDVRIGPRPWLWELERYRYFFHRPVTIAIVDLHTVEVTRIRYGDVQATGGVDWSEHPLMKRHGRAATEGRGAVGAAAGGWHSKNKIEEVVDAHRAMFSKEAAREVEKFLDGATFVVAGPDEARAQLLGELPEEVRARAIQLPGNESHRPRERRELLLLAARVAEEHSRREARAALERWRGSGKFLSGPEALRTALEEGRVDSILFHENGVGHWGTADDARHVPPLGDEALLEELLGRALDTSASVLFGDLEELVEEGCAAALLRW